jgi:muramoyltetrapeptide carboxypeptidase
MTAMPSAQRNARIKPSMLRHGDTVGIVAPASNIKRDALERGCSALARLGYRPFHFDSILERDLYFAGSAERRVRELEEMFRLPEVQAIVCARGGYGANYLLGALDLAVVRGNPKIFVGYSDMTTLLTWLADAAGLVTFHGPMAAKDFTHNDGVDAASWTDALTGSSSWSALAGEGLIEGEAEGVFYGGCLSMLAASLGTPYEIQTHDTILFLEDVATKPYQIDRMLMQLKLAGKFAGVRGIVFGEMLGCVQAPNQEYTLQDVVRRVVGELGVPVAYGLRSGHVTSRNITLPIGVRARLRVSGESAEVTFLEPATRLDEERA